MIATSGWPRPRKALYPPLTRDDCDMKAKRTRVLAGDIGGTKTILSLAEKSSEGVFREIATTTFASGEHDDLEKPTAAFLDGFGERPVAAAFGVAGPVRNGCVRTTNLPWVVDANAVASTLGISRVVVINDFEATALGLATLKDDELRVLQEGLVRPEGPIAVLGAGTGLGEAILLPMGRDARVLPTEGGHASFAPRDEVEDELLRFCRRRFPEHVSYERLLSGPGLETIHSFVLQAGLAESSEATLARLRTEDPGAVIGELGTTNQDAACARALTLFVSIYGSEAGNLALKTLPTGGLFVAGGIAPKILSALEYDGAFIRAFLAKGRMRKVLETIRVSVVLEPRVALRGARALAEKLYQLP